MRTCLPLTATANAARTATSVLPKPTSPQTRRSIGCGASRSSLTASIAVRWSSVSRYGNSLQALDPLMLDLERDARLCLTLGVELQQLSRQLAQVLARPGLEVVPGLAAELR